MCADTRGLYAHIAGKDAVADDCYRALVIESSERESASRMIVGRRSTMINFPHNRA